MPLDDGRDIESIIWTEKSFLRAILLQSMKEFQTRDCYSCVDHTFVARSHSIVGQLYMHSTQHKTIKQRPNVGHRLIFEGFHFQKYTLTL